jgi:hypothetical protein
MSASGKVFDVPAWIVYYALITVAALVLGLVLGWLKNRDAQHWAFYCFLFPPAVILLLLLPKHVGPRPKRTSWDEDHKRTLARDDFD